MNDKRLDALCIASVDSEADTINDVIRSGMPIVLVDRVMNDVNTSQVCWNDEQSAEQLTKLLLANNHRRIAVVNVTLSHSVGRNRLAGFKKAMQEAQISLPKSYISPSNFSAEDAYRYVLRVMKYHAWLDEIPVIVISAAEDTANIERAYDLGATDFIGRPFNAAIAQRPLFCGKYIFTA